MSEAAHDNESLKLYIFHSFAFDSGDNSPECINRVAVDYMLWQPVTVRYRTRGKRFLSLLSLTRSDKETRGIHVQLMFYECLNCGLIRFLFHSSFICRPFFLLSTRLYQFKSCIMSPVLDVFRCLLVTKHDIHALDHFGLIDFTFIVGIPGRTSIFK